MRTSTLLLLLACVFVTSCKTVRTTTTRESSYGINTGDDSDKIREKYDSKFLQDENGNLIPAKKDKDGNLVPDERKRNLFADKSTGKGDAFEKKEARLTKRETEKKQARLPEYLERQKFKGGNKSAAESSVASRSADFDSNRSRDAGRVSGAQGKPSVLSRLNPFKADSNASSQNTVERKSDRRSAKKPSIAPVPMQNFGEAPIPSGSTGGSKRSVDEVKRLLSPSRT